MTQTTLADFAGMLSEVHERVKRIEDSLKRSQSTAALYQTRYGQIKETVMALKDEITRQHQSLSYRDNESRFATVRSQLYGFFRDTLWPSWNPEKEPKGIHFEKIINDFLEAYPHAGKPDTIRRRLNELASRKICKPPPLEWKKPGYYLLRHLSTPIPQETT